jgi:hypothetical protein
MVIRSNALEHIPVVLLLLYTLEYKGAYLMVVPGHGMLLLTARVIHANIILTNNPGRSMPGTRLAIGRFTGLAITGLTFCHLQESLIPGIPPRSAAGNSSNFRSWIQGAGNRFDPAFPASPGRRENY